MQHMGLSRGAIAASLSYFEEHGGYCDCEVLFNVDQSEFGRGAMSRIWRTLSRKAHMMASGYTRAALTITRSL
jgi:hypothetical protein